ncbi:MAG: alpha/beta hydrolase [Emcibacter sp.]|nr:alpha/beta hydrolase [Emcibacter sp.]
MTIDQQTAALLDLINQHVASPGEEVTIANARAGANALFSGFAGEIEQNCLIKDRLIKGQDHDVPVRIYHPGGGTTSSSLPVILFFHGGGWSLGDVDSYDSLVRSLCVSSGAIYISVDYRLGPEHKYPAALNDCLTVTEWLLAHGGDIGGDISRIAVMGDSAGGNLATITAHKINSRSNKAIKAQFLLYPVIDISRPHDHYPSRITKGNGEYLLSRDGIDVAVDWYLTKGDDRADPTISPIRQDDLSPLPPTVILVGGLDPLLDEARAYHDKLTACGVASTLECYDTTIHAFLSFGTMDIAHKGRKYIANKVRELL